MHDWNPAAPPPGRLGAVSLGLMLPVVSEEVDPPPGNVAVAPTPGAGVESPPGVLTVEVMPPGVVTVAPPLPRNVDVVGGESGATGATCGAGVPMADGGSAPRIGAGVAGVVLNDPVDRPMEDDPAPIPEPAPIPDPVPEPPPRPPVWAAASCSDPGTSRPAPATMASQVVDRTGMMHLRSRQRTPHAQRATGRALHSSFNHMCVRRPRRMAVSLSQPPPMCAAAIYQSLGQLYPHGGRALCDARR
jgi:hypothetical protein